MKQWYAYWKNRIDLLPILISIDCYRIGLFPKSAEHLISNGAEVVVPAGSAGHGIAAVMRAVSSVLPRGLLQTSFAASSIGSTEGRVNAWATGHRTRSISRRRCIRSEDSRYQENIVTDCRLRALLQLEGVKYAFRKTLGHRRGLTALAMSAGVNRSAVRRRHPMCAEQAQLLSARATNNSLNSPTASLRRFSSACTQIA